jgi:plastocyanin
MIDARQPRMSRICAFAWIAGLLMLAACAQSDGESVVELAMKDSAFEPKVVRMPVGGTLRISNEGHTTHSTYAVNGTRPRGAGMKR